jgi:LysR family transcriptional activator of nhaA
MMKTFGESGAGIVFAPTVIGAQVSDQYQVVAPAQVDDVVEQVYAITIERRMSHPATVAISTAARDQLFV